MRFLISGVLLFLCGVVLAGDESKAKAALALAQASREREGKAEACAKAKAALVLAKVNREREECMTDYDAALLRAKSNDKLLFLWVGMTCEKEVRTAFKDEVHCHLETLNGNATPRVLVGKIGGTHYYFLKKDFQPNMPEVIRRVVAPSKGAMISPVTYPETRSVSLPVISSGSC